MTPQEERDLRKKFETFWHSDKDYEKDFDQIFDFLIAEMRKLDGEWKTQLGLETEVFFATVDLREAFNAGYDYRSSLTPEAIEEFGENSQPDFDSYIASKELNNTEMKTLPKAEDIIKDIGSPFQKTFEPDGDNLHLESNVIRYMHEFTKQVLDYVAENAKTIKTGNSGSWYDASVDKQSILDVKYKLK